MRTAKDALLERCVATAQRRLTQVLYDAIDGLPQRAASEGGYLDSQHVGTCASLVAAQATAWRGEILDTFQRHFATLLAGRDSRQTRTPESAARGFANQDRVVLRLIDEKPTDEDLDVVRMARASRDRLEKDTCQALEMRLGNLCNARCLEGAANPIGPEAVFTALTRACATASSEPEVKAALCEALQAPITAALNGLYKEVNAFLREQGVTIEPRNARAAQVDVDRPEAQTIDTATTALDAAFHVIQRATPRATTDADSDALTHITNALLVAERQAGTGAVDLVKVINLVLNGPAEAISLGAVLLGDTQSALYKKAISQPLAPQVAEALTVAQGNVPTDRKCRPRAMSATEITALLDHVHPKHKHPIDILTGRLVAGVFQHILEDEDLPLHVKDELARLQIVAMKAALLDRTFFARVDHPLRRMMSSIAGLSLDPEFETGPDGPYDRVVNQTVEYVVRNFETDLRIFQLALDRFSDGVRKHANRNKAVVNALAETLAAREFVEAAREDARQQISIRIAQSKRTPPFVDAFLRNVWVDLLAESDIHGLADEDSYAARFEIAEQLLWSVTPKKPEEMATFIALLPGLINGLRRGMRAANLPNDDERQFLMALMATHTRQRQLAPLDQEEAGHSGQVITVGVESDTRPVKVFPFPGVKPGDILEFREQNKIVRRKLVWISPRNSLYIFCSDQAGQKSMSAGDLAEAMGLGLVAHAPRKDTIIERAVAAVTRPLVAA